MNLSARTTGLEPLNRKDGNEENLFERNPPISAAFSGFPSTRFYGSKRRQLPWLGSEFGSVSGKTVLDAFGGTGAVSYLLSRLGWEVTYNDIFDFNTISAKVILTSKSDLLSDELLNDFFSDIEPFEGFISKNFSELYFSDEENYWLDGAMRSLKKFDLDSREILLYLLFQACLKKRPFNLFHRANLHMRNSTIPVKFGNRTTWNKSFIEHMNVAYVELKKNPYRSYDSIKINKPACAQNVTGHFDMIYVDPPYFKKNKATTDTYLQRYHFLEGLARFEEWESLIDFRSPIKTMKSAYRGEVVNKKNLLSDLNCLMTRHKNSIFAMSYVSDEDPSEEELYHFFKNRFDKVRLSRRSFSKALSNKKTFELLLIGR